LQLLIKKVKKRAYSRKKTVEQFFGANPTNRQNSLFQLYIIALKRKGDSKNGDIK